MPKIPESSIPNNDQFVVDSTIPVIQTLKTTELDERTFNSYNYQILDYGSMWKRKVIFNDIADVIDGEPVDIFFINHDNVESESLPSMMLEEDSEIIPKVEEIEQPEEHVINIQDSINNMQKQFETLKNDLKTSCPPGYKCIPNTVWSSLSNKIDNLDSEFDNSLILDGDK